VDQSLYGLLVIVPLDLNDIGVIEEYQCHDHSNLKYGPNAICSWLIMWPFRLA